MKLKKLLVIAGTVFTAFSLLGGMKANVSAASKEDVEAYVNTQSRVKPTIDVDGNGPWCVDLIYDYFMNVYGIPSLGGNADYYMSCNLPEGWYRYGLGVETPQLGDIVVWDNSWGYTEGHVGIVLSSDANGVWCLDQNGFGGTKVDKSYYSYSDPNMDFGTFIRPYVTPSAPVVDSVKVKATLKKELKLSFNVSVPEDIVDYVEVSVYTQNGGRDDLTTEKIKVNKAKKEVSLNIKCSDHNNEMGTYYVSIIAHGSKGGVKQYDLEGVNYAWLYLHKFAGSYAKPKVVAQSSTKYHVKNAANGKYLNVYTGQLYWCADCTTINTFNLDAGDPGQIFTLENDASDGSYRITSARVTHLLNIAYRGSGAGALLYPKAYDVEAFFVEPADDGSVYFVLKNNQALCLAVDGDSVVLTENKGSSNSKWYLEELNR